LTVTIYLLNNEGTAIASTVSDDNLSFTGHNYSYRYYFTEAIKGNKVIYPALGTTSKKRGVYFSYPIYSSDNSQIIGVLVFKKDMNKIDLLISEFDDPIFIISPDGIIFATNNEQWLYHYTLPLSSEKIADIENSKQFGEMKIKPFPSDLTKTALDFNNISYYVTKSDFLNSQWQIVILKQNENVFLIDINTFKIIMIIPIALLLIIVVLIKIIFYKKKTETELRRSNNEIIIREKKLKASLIEKDILLKEIHHRVKNNMQIMNSLLSMQIDKINDNCSIQILKNSQNRIRAMALVHENIYESENFSSITMKNIITELLQNLISDEQLKNDNISLEMDIDNIIVSIDHAIPLGLIINEVVTNTLKHAFKDDMAGNLTVTLKRLVSKECLLVIKDNGLGLPVDFSFDDSDDLGLLLVKNLVVQIDGVLNIDKNKGVSYSIRFHCN
jgi:two-component sensor histidine kinase